MRSLHSNSSAKAGSAKYHSTWPGMRLKYTAQRLKKKSYANAEQAIVRMVHIRGHLPSVNGIEVILFGLSSGILFNRLHHNPSTVGNFKWMMSSLVGNDTKPRATATRKAKSNSAFIHLLTSNIHIRRFMKGFLIGFVLRFALKVCSYS